MPRLRRAPIRLVHVEPCTTSDPCSWTTSPTATRTPRPAPLRIISVRFERLIAYNGAMAGAIAHDKAPQLRDAVDEALRAAPEITDSARAAFARLVDVLESSDDAVVFPAEATISTSQAAALLGVSRMTVVRLVDRGELRAETSTVHRRVPVSELARYQAETQARRRSAMAELAGDVTEATPSDRVIETR